MNLRPVSVGAALAATLSAHLCSAQQPKVAEPTHTAWTPYRLDAGEGDLPRNPFHLGNLLQVHLRRRGITDVDVGVLCAYRQGIRVYMAVTGSTPGRRSPAFSTRFLMSPTTTGTSRRPTRLLAALGFISWPAQALLTTTLI